MARRIAYEKIFTPQGLLGQVSKNPNLDFLMNIFKIPRIYGVSGFGDWDVGQHTVCTAFLVLYWAKFNKYAPAKRDRLVTMALLHDTHEAVTGDILPFFKTPAVKRTIDIIQKDILDAFSVHADKRLLRELKLIDMVSFLYEIAQSSPKGLNPAKKRLLKKIYRRQRETIFEYVNKVKLEKRTVEKFLKHIKL